MAVLATSMKGTLDLVFLRRIRFVVNFPFLDMAQRAEIQRSMFVADTPLDVLSIGELARENAAGGSIRSSALGTAFLADKAGEPVRMTHLARATRGEYAKLKRSLTDAEIGGWVCK
jgi:hypothetical protein